MGSVKIHKVRADRVEVLLDALVVAVEAGGEWLALREEMREELRKYTAKYEVKNGVKSKRREEL